MLEIDEDSRLGKEMMLGGVRYGALDTPSEDATADFYELAVERLLSATPPYGWRWPYSEVRERRLRDAAARKGMLVRKARGDQVDVDGGGLKTATCWFGRMALPYRFAQKLLRSCNGLLRTAFRPSVQSR
jgi:hypothetical protein